MVGVITATRSIIYCTHSLVLLFCSLKFSHILEDVSVFVLAIYAVCSVLLASESYVWLTLTTHANRSMDLTSSYAIQILQLVVLFFPVKKGFELAHHQFHLFTRWMPYFLHETHQSEKKRFSEALQGLDPCLCLSLVAKGACSQFKVQIHPVLSNPTKYLVKFSHALTCQLFLLYLSIITVR